MSNTDLISPTLPLETIKFHITNFNYRLWHRHGIRTMSQLMQGSKLKQFTELRQEFTLPTTAAYSFMQLQSWFAQQPKHKPSKAPNPMWKHVEQICKATKPANKLISTIYISEHTKPPKTPPSFISAWEKDA
ncbi:Hypothetical predicted protein [Pelobates cultripes]|uniref:Uncharacterized protein n=1 Tax=Pelobates cultripes TaxID=61616 RepID=A0AAD1RYG5_PELCU|nr:Hypothetical predicted protein [Pelobates cultripes]